MRRALEDGLISAAGVLVILVGLVVLDARVRERVEEVLAPGQPQVELARASARASRTAAIVADAVRHQTIEQAPLVVFVAAGGGLFLAMLRL